MPQPANTTPTTITRTLVDLGLSENEAALYEILLKNPEATIPLLQQKSPFSRTMLYYILESLEGYGLVSDKKEGKKTVYAVEPPQKLQDFVKDQEEELKRHKTLLTDVMADLTSAYNLAHNKPGVRFFEGPEGIKEVTFDSLKATGTIYTFIDMEGIEKYAKKMNADYVAERIKRGIPKKQISLDTPYTRERYKQMPPPSRLLEVRLIPQALNPFKSGMQIYNDTISYSTLTDEAQIGVIIVDKNIANMHRSLFEYIWNSLTPLQQAPPNAPKEAAPKNNTVFRSPDNPDQSAVR